MEYCAHGDLFTYVVEQGLLAEHEARSLFSQILHAVHFIHARGIAHRDLKPENIFLDESNNVKLGDFGLCHIVGHQTLLTTPCGSPLYAPPEVIGKEPYDGRIADVWSLGVLLFTMVTGTLPWSKSNQIALLKEISRGRIEIPTTLSPLPQEVLVGMLQRNPEQRSTVQQVIDSPWFTHSEKTKCRHAMTMSCLVLPVSTAHPVLRGKKVLVRPGLRRERMASASVPPALFPEVRQATARASALWA
jgi:serine/threonine protein kinase